MTLFIILLSIMGDIKFYKTFNFVYKTLDFVYKRFEFVYKIVCFVYKKVDSCYKNNFFKSGHI